MINFWYSATTEQKKEIFILEKSGEFWGGAQEDQNNEWN